MIALILSFDSVVPNCKNIENWVSLLLFYVRQFFEYEKYVFFYFQAKKVFGWNKFCASGTCLSLCNIPNMEWYVAQCKVGKIPLDKQWVQACRLLKKPLDILTLQIILQDISKVRKNHILWRILCCDHDT